MSFVEPLEVAPLDGSDPVENHALVERELREYGGGPGQQGYGRFGAAAGPRRGADRRCGTAQPRISRSK